MAWIESHQSLSRHRKTIRAVAILRVDRHKFIGHMHELWWWGLDNVPMNGWLNTLSDKEIAEGAQWKGDPTAFTTALITAGFIDVDPNGQRWLHNWYKYAGKLLKKRADNAARMREARAGEGKRVNEENAPNVQDTCEDTSDARAGARGEERTVPNSTEQNQDTGGREDAGEDAPSAPSCPDLLKSFDAILVARGDPSYQPTSAFYATVVKNYSALDLSEEGVKLLDWLSTDKARRLKRTLTTRYILGWLRRSLKEQGGNGGIVTQPAGGRVDPAPGHAGTGPEPRAVSPFAKYSRPYQGA